ncbi:MAG: Fe-Mn family superoxide dismutase, partial [Candidatus Omnitrophota bacterium]
EQSFPNLKNLKNITEGQIAEHLKLYAGYVKNTNLLNEQLAEIIQKVQTGTPVYAELTRRLGFEYNGMRLHEYYFRNLSGQGGGDPKPSTLTQKINESFGSFANWKQDFLKIGAMRGVGWGILYLDACVGRLSNHWITLHEEGHVAGFRPILVMDLWEHAWSVYLKPTERARYLEDFFANIDWAKANERLERALTSEKANVRA